MLGRSRTRDNGEFVAIALFRLKYASAATEMVHVLVDLWADCVCESGISASFPIMAAALLPGPSSPLLFFRKRELWRQRRRREGLTQRRPHTTAPGRLAAARSPVSALRLRASLLTSNPFLSIQAIFHKYCHHFFVAPEQPFVTEIIIFCYTR